MKVGQKAIQFLSFIQTMLKLCLNCLHHHKLAPLHLLLPTPPTNILLQVRFIILNKLSFFEAETEPCYLLHLEVLLLSNFESERGNFNWRRWVIEEKNYIMKKIRLGIFLLMVVKHISLWILPQPCYGLSPLVFRILIPNCILSIYMAL